MIYPDCGFLKIAVGATWDIQELLRIAVYDRKPAALYLNHDTMALFESMGDSIEVKLHFSCLARNKRFGIFITIPEFRPEYLSANQALKTTYFLFFRIVRVCFFRSRKHINQFYDQICIGTR